MLTGAPYANCDRWLFVFLLLVVASIYEYVSFWPRFRSAVAAGRTGARTQAYWRIVMGQWLFAVTGLGIWMGHRRPWADLLLTVPRGWRLALAVTLVLAAVALLLLQLWSVARLSPDRRFSARPKLGAVTFMLPHTAAEERCFLALSLTAGFCEELLYRGYLTWFFMPWLGQVGAMSLMVALFGISG
jgi:CAAX protease family protein